MNTGCKIENVFVSTLIRYINNLWFSLESSVTSLVKFILRIFVAIANGLSLLTSLSKNSLLV